MSSNSASDDGLPSWACDDCDQSFNAFTEVALEHKVRSHQSSCNPDSDLEWKCETCEKELEAYSEGKLRHKVNSHKGTCQAPESGRCERCGRYFEAQSKEQLQQKLEDHRSDCYEMTRHSPTKDIGIQSIPVPRSPSAYQKTEHFVARKKMRTNPEVTKDVIFKTLTQGRIIPTQNSQRYKFVNKLGGNQWCIVVHLMDKGFVKPDKKHVVLTVYEKNSHQHEKAGDLGL